MPSGHAQALVDVLRRHAASRGDDKAVTFVGDNGIDQTWNYAELDARARAMASRLLQLAAPGERVLLLCPQGLEFVSAILGCFYAGLVAVPAYPPANPRHLPRIARILADSQASVIVTTSGARGRIEGWLDRMRDEGRAAGALLLCEDVDPAGADRFVDPDLASDSYAFLQYTSGSTSAPRGVIVTHGNLLANLAMIRDSFELTDRSDSVSWLPVFHDMGLIGSLLEPLYLGAHAVLLAPTAFIRRPVTWLEAITRFRPHWVGAPNFGYARCVDGVSAEQRSALDLSSLRIAYCGSEPIDPRVADDFAAAFAPCGFDPQAFYPCYGLAEATLLAAGGKPGTGGRRFCLDGSELEQHRARVVAPGSAGARTLFSCGSATRGEVLRIVNPDARMPLADGEVGEVWLAGPHVAAGYWGNADETRAVFGARLADGSDERGYLRTGDLGFVSSGEVCITGRIKDVLIIRGRNHYPQDIEQTVAKAHAGLQPAGGGAAFSVLIDGREHPVVVQEVRRAALRQLDFAAVASAICQAVAQEHELALRAVVLLQPATLPRTSSGKVQRRECARLFASGGLAEVFRWDAPALDEAADDASAADKERAGFDAGSRARADRLIAWLRHYAEQRIDSRLFDERRTISPYVVLDFGRMGVLGLAAPREAGGLELSHHDMLRILQQLAAIDVTLASFVGVHNALGLRPLLRHGTLEQQRAMLADLAQGRQLASFAFTEPAAGSDPTAIRATAVENPDGSFSLNGSKRWIGTAAWAGYIHVFAHVIDRAGVNRGITAFTVPQGTPGLVQGPEELTVGMRGMVQNTVELRDVRLGRADMLGRTGRGMQIAQDIMEFGRICIAAVAVGVLKRSAQLMTRYATRRQIATGRLLDNVVSRERLTAVLVETAALEQFVDAFAAWLDAGREVPGEMYAAIKVLSAEAAYRGVDSLVQMLGGRGYIESNLVPQMMRDVRLLRIFEGPSETMLGFVGSRVAAGSEPLRSFLDDVLGAGALCATLDGAAQKLAVAKVDRQRRITLLGELGAWIVWRAVLDRTAAATAPALAARAREWVASHVAAALAAVDKAADGAMAEPLAAGEIESLVAGLARDIGDHEQHRPGVVAQLDPLLRRDSAVSELPLQPARPTMMQASSAPSVFAVARSPGPASAQASTSGDMKSDAIERWLQRWIAMRTQQDAAGVERRRPFAEYGLDSVTAVELADELSQFVGMDVPATAAWDHPNIAALAAALVGTSGSGRVVDDGDGRPANGNGHIAGHQASGEVDLDLMSEHELAGLLAGALDDSEGRRR